MRYYKHGYLYLRQKTMASREDLIRQLRSHLSMAGNEEYTATVHGGDTVTGCLGAGNILHVCESTPLPWYLIQSTGTLKPFHPAPNYRHCRDDCLLFFHCFVCLLPRVNSYPDYSLPVLRVVCTSHLSRFPRSIRSRMCKGHSLFDLYLHTRILHDQKLDTLSGP